MFFLNQASTLITKSLNQVWLPRTWDWFGDRFPAWDLLRFRVEECEAPTLQEATHRCGSSGWELNDVTKHTAWRHQRWHGINLTCLFHVFTSNSFSLEERALDSRRAAPCRTGWGMVGGVEERIMFEPFFLFASGGFGVRAPSGW